ncbi:MAG TPA: methyltransferase domain-containing protein [Azospirillum sp.]|nr:methyltransferase domain-containing protein [Azospirillum sp.]
MGGYVHGYSAREAERLSDQAAILCPLLHHDTVFPPGSRVLEAGCGTGGQTGVLLDGTQGIRLTCLDIDGGQLDLARARLGERAAEVTWRQGDLLAEPFPDASFDHAFVCFVLEHLAHPEPALAALRRVVRPGGTIMVVEGDHGSCRFHPETPGALAVWDELVAAQRRLGGDPMIGRRLHGLLAGAGFADVRVSPRMVYADAGNPALREGFVRRIIVPMVDGVRAQAVERGFDPAAWERGIADLLATDADGRGAFCYTFFKATARVP